MQKIKGIYYLSKQEVKNIEELPERSRKKWNKRIVRDIDDYYHKKNRGIGSNREQLRKRKFSTVWRDGEQKDFREHKTKRVLTRTELKQKRKKERLSRSN